MGRLCTASCEENGDLDGEIRAIRTRNRIALDDSNRTMMLAKYFMKKRSPWLYDRRWSLAEDAPERRNFDSFSWGRNSPPFTVEFVTAGPRIGWRWTNCCRGGSCEVQWIDPEPEVGGEGYNQYLEAMERIKEDTVFFAGYSSPPSEEEFHRIIATRMESTNR